jgi:hypothetical protein
MKMLKVSAEIRYTVANKLNHPDTPIFTREFIKEMIGYGIEDVETVDVWNVTVEEVED